MICHGKRGQIQQAYRDGQEDQLGCLGLGLMHPGWTGTVAQSPVRRPHMPMSARWRRTGLRRDECVCDARGKIRRGEPVDGNYGEIWSLWASWR